MKAIEAVRRRPVTVGPDTTLAEGAALMDAEGVGALMVVENDRILGIVTDRDIVIRSVARSIPADARIDSAMSTDLITLGADAGIQRAFDIFRAHAVRRLPLVEGGRLVGVVTVDDLLINLIGNLGDLARPITGEVIFGYHRAGELAST